MDDDERQYGDSDAQEEIARTREMRRRAMWRPDADDPYPDWEDEDEDEPCEEYPDHRAYPLADNH